jgi:hypothetical protein
MNTCKNCTKPIEVKQGRRPREFCDNNQKCRNEWFRKNKKAATHKTIPIAEWNELQSKLLEERKATKKTELIGELMTTPNGDKIPKEDIPNYADKVTKDRIEQLEKELRNIPATLKIPKKLYISLREKELSELKSKLL